MPDKLIKRAGEILKQYENNKNVNIVPDQISMNFEENNENNIKYDIIKKKLEDINPLEISPMEAFNILFELKKDIE